MSCASVCVLFIQIFEMGRARPSGRRTVYFPKTFKNDTHKRVDISDQ